MSMSTQTDEASIKLLPENFIYIVPQKRFHAHYCRDGHSGINDWDFVLFEQCETHEQLKERETFWQHRLKTFYPIGLNEKEEYLY